MRATLLSIACLAGLGLSATSAKAGTFDIVVRFPSWGYTYVSPYPAYYPPIYAPLYQPVIQTPIIVAPRTYFPGVGYPGYYRHHPLPVIPHGHRHHR